MRIRSRKNAAAGFLLIVLALAFGVESAKLSLGTAVNMGPGYFPTALSIILGLLGVIVLAGSLAFEDAAMPSQIGWRGLAAIVAATVVFGVGVRGLGFVPSLFIALVISTFASADNTWKRALFPSIGLTAFCWLVFIKGIGLPIQLIGPWLGGH